MSSIDGTYRVDGHTINSYDGNKTIITSMMLRLANGRLWASGCYDSGTNYNTEKSVVWSGSYNGDELEWTEKYGETSGVFIYHGFIQNKKLCGTYKWTANAASGSFEFSLQRLSN
ncbi:unnamed protein product [Rotaria magnacalcarata]|uniref:Uncharacterized protein n=2 Tax=Rotaria magnacalcarata TaxID=392030 RepID=A0A815FD52_9BILA|nr:unnamed protein product [Rotaria magnacalcarata]CAF1323833.1 unnamed protein product [Rotaria magnacalcarata]CAF1944631.1 unnamed protein product [Rotaria magnacalcarata]CAF1992215.1 unnamed protein product [Rotaria magnacalcarata]CAF2109054.1 unnamed protein product [Rotaria magnacalcarata]